MKSEVLTEVKVANSSENNQVSTWAVDVDHSNVKFSVSHLVIAEAEGHFKNYSAEIVSGEPDFSDAVINFSIDVNSISTGNDMRDGHLKSDDFFNTEKFPLIRFENTSLTNLGNKKYLVEGDLTIRDVTKRAKFEVVYRGTVVDPYGNIKAAFKANGAINRFDFGLKWSALTEAGGLVVGDEVSITLNLELAKQK